MCNKCCNLFTHHLFYFIAYEITPSSHETRKSDHEHDDVPHEELWSSRSLRSTTEAWVLQGLATGYLTDGLVPDVDKLVQTPFLFAADCLGANCSHHRRTLDQLDLCHFTFAHNSHRQVLYSSSSRSVSIACNVKIWR